MNADEKADKRGAVQGRRDWRKRRCGCGCGKPVDFRIMIDLAHAAGCYERAMLKSFGLKFVGRETSGVADADR